MRYQTALRSDRPEGPGFLGFLFRERNSQFSLKPSFLETNREHPSFCAAKIPTVCSSHVHGAGGHDPSRDFERIAQGIDTFERKDTVRRFKRAAYRLYGIRTVDGLIEILGASG